MKSVSTPAKDHLVLILATCLYLPLIFIGYGTDNDSFNVLGTGRHFLQTGEYIASRHPGYIVHEAATLVLNQLGGNVLTNLGTMLMALLSIAAFQAICRFFAVPHRHWLSLTLAVHPIFWANGTCTIDYLWALGLIMSGFWLWVRGRYVGGGLLFGLALSARLSSGIAVVMLILFFLWRNQSDRRRVLFAASIAFGVGGLLYVPSWIGANWTLAFLEPHLVDIKYWTLPMKIGRFGYKSIYFFGLPASLLLFGFTPFLFRNVGKSAHKCWLQGENVFRSDEMPSDMDSQNEPQRADCLPFLCALLVAGYLLLFLKFPLENEYLLPMWPFLLLWIGLAIGNRRRLIVALFVLIFSYNIININIARPDTPNAATAASYGLWIERGYLIEHTMMRWELRHCQTTDCWHQIMDAPN